MLGKIQFDPLWLWAGCGLTLSFEYQHITTMWFVEQCAWLHFPSKIQNFGYMRQYQYFERRSKVKVRLYPYNYLPPLTKLKP